MAAAIGSANSRGNTLMSRRRRFGLLCLTAVFMAAVVSATSAQDSATASLGLESILDDCKTLKLAEAGKHVKDKTVRLGHMEMMFVDGTLVPVLGKAGSVLGAYFEGRGAYVYTTDDLADRDALAMNAARVAGSLRVVDGRVNDTFQSVLVLFSEPRFSALYASLEGAEDAPSEPMSQAFQAAALGAKLSYPEFDFRTASARLNGHGLWAYAAFDGSLKRVGFVYDDIVGGRERFFTFRKLADYNVLFSETMSYQDLPGWSDGQRNSVVLTHAEVAIATTDNKVGTIDSDMTYRVQGSGTRLISLNLLNTRDPDAKDWNSPLQKLTVSRVLDADGNALPFSHKYGELIVEVPPTQAPASDLRLRFESSGDVFVDMSGGHADNYFSLEGDSWYPAPHGWGGQQFTYSLRVTLKKPWRPVTSGLEVSLREDGQFVTVEARSDVPSMQIAVLGGKYFSRSETIDGLTIRAHAYAWNRKEVLDNMPKLAAGFVKFFFNTLGPIKLAELDIVEVPEFGFGISPSGMVLITSEAYANVHAKFASGVNARLAHELAHQWFGHKAVPLEATDNWLAESFAEYFAGLAMGALASNEKAMHGFNEMLTEWRTEARQCASGGTIATANYLGGRDGAWDRTCLLYARGPLVLHMLRTSIGNDRFFAATKKFLDAASEGPVTTADYVKAVSDTVQMDMRWFFDQWVLRGGNAEIEVEQHVDPAANGQFRLWGTIRQAPGDGFKKVLVPLVWDNGGKPEARVVFADQPEKTFEFLLPAKPGTIKPDPFQNNLATYK